MNLAICFFGAYKLESGYPVNGYILEGLRDAGCEVQECRETVWEGFLHEGAGWQWRSLIKVALKALKGYISLVRRYRRVDVHHCVMVGYPGFVEVLIGRMLNLFKDRCVVLVSFISLYDTVVVDRKLVMAGSWRAVLLKILDRKAFEAADVVLVDTHEQARYYAMMFGLPEGKFIRSFVGHEFQEYAPCRPRSGEERGLRVLFYGTYVPLHGIDVILDAAAQLELESGINFTLVGRGQLFEELELRARDLTNVKLIDRWIGVGELVEHICSSDLCLGIFGRTAKAARVIPYKVFGAVALGKAVVTRDSPAIREFFRNDESALLCAPEGPDLAKTILRVCANRELLQQVASAGHRRYLELGTPAAVGANLRPAIEQRLAG